MKVNPMRIGEYYFPTNLQQVENLLGKMLTHIEAMNLPQTVEKANKDLVRQTLWKWWSDVQENSMTSYKGCVGPLGILETNDSDSTQYIWYTDIGETKPTKEAEFSQVPVVDVSSSNN